MFHLRFKIFKFGVTYGKLDNSRYLYNLYSLNNISACPLAPSLIPILSRLVEFHGLDTDNL